MSNTELIFEIIKDRDEFLKYIPKIDEMNGKYKKGGNLKFLLIGSGFSGRFNRNLIYNNLIDKITCCKCQGYNKSICKNYDVYIKEICDHFDTKNMEDIYKKLKHININISLHTESNHFIKRLLRINKSTLLKHCLTTNIINKCVINTIIYLSDYKSVKDYLDDISNFLLCFDGIFTLAYDPILYWAILSEVKKYSDIHQKSNQNSDSRNNYPFCPPFCDYFTKNEGSDSQMLVFKKSNNIINNGKQHRDCTFVHYLHGSTFLKKEVLKSGSETVNKKSYNSNDEANKNIIDEENYPLFILDGSSKNKLEKIQKNEYLKFTYDILKNLNSFSSFSGTTDSDKKMNYLCILGFGANETDQHILDAISNNDKLLVILCVYKESNDCSLEDYIKHHSEKYKKLIKDLNSKGHIVKIYDVSKADSILCGANEE